MWLWWPASSWFRCWMGYDRGYGTDWLLKSVLLRLSAKLRFNNQHICIWTLSLLTVTCRFSTQKTHFTHCSGHFQWNGPCFVMISVQWWSVDVLYWASERVYYAFVLFATFIDISMRRWNGWVTFLLGKIQKLNQIQIYQIFTYHYQLIHYSKI